MPIHAAGPRTYSSVKFKHLVHKAGSAKESRPMNVSLNLTPFVDMMTILVAFLLMVFSASKLLQVQAGLELPKTDGNKGALQDAPVIIVTKSDITFNGEMIVTTDAVLRDDSPTFKIDALFERLDAAAKKVKEEVGRALSGTGSLSQDLKTACEQAKEGGRPQAGHICPDGLAILEADESTDTRVINKVVVTAKAAGFDNLLFAVKNK